MISRAMLVLAAIVFSSPSLACGCHHNRPEIADSLVLNGRLDTSVFTGGVGADAAAADYGYGEGGYASASAGANSFASAFAFSHSRALARGHMGRGTGGGHR